MTSLRRAAASGRACSAESMELDIGAQAAEILLAHLGGWLLGLLYDLLRPPRRRLRPLPAAMLDIVYCAAAFSAVFIFAMSAGSGRVGTWELFAALLGFLAYMHSLSRIFAPWLDKICAAAWRAVGRGKNLSKKVWKIAKRYFQKSKECFIIKDGK